MFAYFAMGAIVFGAFTIGCLIDKYAPSIPVLRDWLGGDDV